MQECEASGERAETVGKKALEVEDALKELQSQSELREREAQVYRAQAAEAVVQLEQQSRALKQLETKLAEANQRNLPPSCARLDGSRRVKRTDALERSLGALWWTPRAVSRRCHEARRTN